MLMSIEDQFLIIKTLSTVIKWKLICQNALLDFYSFIFYLIKSFLLTNLVLPIVLVLEKKAWIESGLYLWHWNEADIFFSSMVHQHESRLHFCSRRAIQFVRFTKEREPDSSVSSECNLKIKSAVGYTWADPIHFFLKRPEGEECYHDVFKIIQRKKHNTS